MTTRWLCRTVLTFVFGYGRYRSPTPRQVRKKRPPHVPHRRRLVFHFGQDRDKNSRFDNCRVVYLSPMNCLGPGTRNHKSPSKDYEVLFYVNNTRVHMMGFLTGVTLRNGFGGLPLLFPDFPFGWHRTPLYSPHHEITRWDTLIFLIGKLLLFLELLLFEVVVNRSERLLLNFLSRCDCYSMYRQLLQFFTWLLLQINREYYCYFMYSQLLF